MRLYWYKFRGRHARSFKRPSKSVFHFGRPAVILLRLAFCLRWMGIFIHLHQTHFRRKDNIEVKSSAATGIIWYYCVTTQTAYVLALFVAK